MQNGVRFEEPDLAWQWGADSASNDARSPRGSKVGGCNARENGPVRYHHLRTRNRQSIALFPESAVLLNCSRF